MTCRYGCYITFCLLLALSGCGPKKGTVSGNVTFGGKPVVWGTVSLFASDNVQYTGQITPEGTYSIPDVPNGPVRITVASPNPDGAARGGAAAVRSAEGNNVDGSPGQALPAKGDWLAIPEKYGIPDQSGLTGEVKKNTVINLHLE